MEDSRNQDLMYYIDVHTVIPPHTYTYTHTCVYVSVSKKEFTQTYTH